MTAIAMSRSCGRTLLLKPWLWLNLVCLDAPIVAITWQWLFARALVDCELQEMFREGGDGRVGGRNTV